MRTIVSTDLGRLVPHKEIDGKQIMSPVTFDVKTFDSKGNRVDSLSGDNIPFGDSFRRLITGMVPLAAAREGSDPEFIGRVMKQSTKNVNRAADDRARRDVIHNSILDSKIDKMSKARDYADALNYWLGDYTDEGYIPELTGFMQDTNSSLADMHGQYRRGDSAELNMEEEAALLDMLQFYNKHARKWAYDPDFISSVSEAPNALVHDFFRAIERGDIPPEVLHPDRQAEVGVLSNMINDDSLENLLADNNSGLALALMLSEQNEPGFIKKFMEEGKAGRYGARVAKVMPLVKNLMDSTAFNYNPATGYSKTRNDELRSRNEMIAQYNKWLEELTPDVSKDMLKAYGKDMSVGKSKILTNILNDSLDFNPLLGPKLTEFVDPKANELGARHTDIWIPRLPGLWSPERKSTPMTEFGSLPVYNFKSDWWQNYASGEARGLDPVAATKQLGFMPNAWGGGISHAFPDGTTAQTKGGIIYPVDYLREALERKRRGYYPNVDFAGMLGEDPTAVLSRLRDKRSSYVRNEKKKVTDKRHESKQRKAMFADKSNVHDWSRMSNSAKNVSFKSMLKQMLNGRNDEYASTVSTLGLDGIEYSDIMADETTKGMLRATHDSLRDAGVPLNEVGNTLLKALAEHKGATKKDDDMVSLSGIASALGAE